VFNVTRKVLCLDWDKRSLRIVAARVTSGKMVLEDAHSHRLPGTLDAEDPEAMGEFIQQMLKRHRLRAKWVLVDVPRERAVINRLSLPPTPTGEVAAAVRFQAMRELPFPLESAAADYVITLRDDDGMAVEALLAAVTKETLDRIRHTCELAGLSPARIGLRPYANLVSVGQVETLEDRRVMFVDVGPGSTEIDIFENNALAFARSANVNVPVPVHDSEAGEDSRIISLAEIADLDSADEAIEAAVHELLVEVTRTLQAYRATEPEGSVDAVVIAGGTGIETQFADGLYEKLGVPVELFDPTEPLGIHGDEAAKLRSFSAALGLAWGLSREGMLALDFLNPKKPVSSREIFRKRFQRVGALGALAAVLGIVLTTWWYMQLAQERDGMNDRNASLREKIAEKQAVQDQVERALEWELNAIWPDELLTVSRAAIEPGKQMLVQSIQMESSRQNHRILLRNLHATDWQIPIDFVRTLNELESGGKPTYEATYTDWKDVDNRGSFTGTTDVQIQLSQLIEEQEEIEKREKKRKRVRR
jgi:type IV pilus assembly protein PilM